MNKIKKFGKLMKFLQIEKRSVEFELKCIASEHQKMRANLKQLESMLISYQSICQQVGTQCSAFQYKEYQSFGRSLESVICAHRSIVDKKSSELEIVHNRLLEKDKKVQFLNKIYKKIELKQNLIEQRAIENELSDLWLNAKLKQI